MTDKVLRNDARGQNVLFCKCCYHQAAFKMTFKGDTDTKNDKGNEESGKG
jgi:hypothetical protein